MSFSQAERVSQYVSLITKTITAGSLIAQVAQIARAKGQPAQVIRNQISAGTFPVRTWKDGGRRVCGVVALAEWLAVNESISTSKPRRGRPKKSSKVGVEGGSK